ncbi:MAG: hypothetical protein ACI4F4_05655 [Lachnospiraceae bacterium]
MEMFGSSYEKSEMLILAEQIYEIKGKIQDKKLSLEDERFHRKYIPQRKEIAYSQAISRWFIILLLSLLVLICLIAFVIGIMLGNRLGNLAIFMIFTGGIVIFGGYSDYKLIRTQLALQAKLHFSFNEAKSIQYAKKKDVVTYQSDELQSDKRISILEEEIKQLSEKLKDLENQQRKFLQEKEDKERILKEKGILFEPEEMKHTDFNGLSLKNRDTYTDDLQELFELYSSEKRYLQETVDRLEFRLKEINLSLTNLNDNYQLAILKIRVAMICLLVFLILEPVFSNFAGNLPGVVICIVSLCGLFYLDNSCSKPILLYLVEQENKWVADYAFMNDLVPIKYQRTEIMEMLEMNQKELMQVQDKLKDLD